MVGRGRPFPFSSIEDVATEAKPFVLVGLTRTGGGTAFVLAPLPRRPIKTRFTSNWTPLVARGEIEPDSSFSLLKSSLTMLVFLS